MNRKVLVADDSATIRMIVQASLAGAGWDVRLAADGAQALALAQAERPDLVITDWNMPVLDGPGLIAAFRADVTLADLPVLVLTTEGDEQVYAQARALGVQGWLGKPVEPDTLVAVVADFLP